MERQINLFIDTNIFLDFYRLADADVKQLDKLLVEVNSGRIILWLPDQIKSEFFTNRDSVLSREYSTFDKLLNKAPYPPLVREAGAFPGTKDLGDRYHTALKILIQDLKTNIVNRTLPADKLIEELFTQATPIQITDELHDKAKRRIELGRPPRKDRDKSDSMRDGISWESLLASKIQGKMHFITRDDDYYCPLNDQDGHKFLKKEWLANANSNSEDSPITFYRSLRAFLKANLSNIKLQEEDTKAESVRSLVNSNSFPHTHFAVAQLSGFSSLNAIQTIAIFNAALENSQIRRILTDPDVLMFYKSNLDQMPIEGVDLILAEKVRQLIKSKEQDEADWHAKISS